MSAKLSIEIREDEGVMAKDRRSSDRHEVDGVQGSLFASADARIVDVSPEGLAIETNRSLRVGRSVPLAVNRKSRVLPVMAKVIWCSLVGTWRSESREVLPVYRAGVRFEEDVDDRVIDLVRFIGKKALLTLETKLYGQFTVHSARHKGIEYQNDFAVRRLGLSGMFVEVDLAPEIGSIVDIKLLVDNEPLEATGRVAHVKRIEWQSNMPLALVDVRFTEMSEPAQRSLESFLRLAVTQTTPR